MFLLERKGGREERREEEETKGCARAHCEYRVVTGTAIGGDKERREGQTHTRFSSIDPIRYQKPGAQD